MRHTLKPFGCSGVIRRHGTAGFEWKHGDATGYVSFMGADRRLFWGFAKFGKKSGADFEASSVCS